MQLRSIAAAVCALALAGAAAAHDTWFDPRADGLYLGTGDHFPKQEFTLEAVALGRHACRGADGRDTPLRALLQTDTALKLAAPPPGARGCWVQLLPFEVQIPPAVVPVYFEDIQADAAVRQAWAEQQARGVPWVERYVKHARIHLQGMPPVAPEMALDALIEPARSIGGDFYDTIRLDSDRVCFLVGDVTGKGVPAALFMALSKALAKSVLLRDGKDLATAMTRLNDEIARDNGEDMFVTMLVGLLNTQTGALELCNAGHENPWLVTEQGDVRHLRPEGGPPLSVEP